MPLEALSVSIEEAWPTAIVVVKGMLRQAGTVDILNCLRKCVAGCPEAIIIDLTGMHAESDVPLTVFGAVHREAAVWPAIPVILCAPSVALVERLARSGLSRRMPVCPDRHAATAAITGPPTIARADHDLGQDPDAPAGARVLITALCAGWGLAPLAEAARLILSELVTNAVVHGAGRIRLTALVRRPYLHLVVRDESPDAPRAAAEPVRGSGLVAGGRGLRLVGRTATGWGYVSESGGKAVWARLRLPPTAPSEAGPKGLGPAGAQAR